MVSDSEMRHLWKEHDKDEAKFKRKVARVDANDLLFESSFYPKQTERQKAGCEL